MSKMNEDMRKVFQNMPGLGKETAEQFITILETDDEKFDQVYPYFKEQISKVYDGEEFQEGSSVLLPPSVSGVLRASGAWLLLTEFAP